jgi:hypothetical protein
MSVESIEGMTVNERLWHFELFEKFDLAARNRDELKLIEILKEAKFSELQATETTMVLLSDPRKYGY